MTPLLATLAILQHAGAVAPMLPDARAAGPSPVAVCFAPGTDPGYMERFSAWVRSASPPGGPDFVNGGRWSSTNLTPNTGVQGDPVTVRWSVPADGLTNIGGGLTSVNELNARMTQWFGSPAAGVALLRQMFAAWSAVSGVRYVETPDDGAPWGANGSATRGDVRIVSINIDGPGSVLAFNFFPDNGDMVIDASDGFGDPSNDFRFFRNTASHEAGHGWGAAHVCPQDGTKLMEPGLNTGFDGPQHDDIRGAHFGYGDVLGSNNSAAAATNIVLDGQGRFSRQTLSLDSPSDEDWLRLTLPTAGTLSATVSIPTIVAGALFLPYQSTSQGANCPAGPVVDPRIVADLMLEIRSNNGATLLASANANGFGGGETLQAVTIPAGGTYFVRVLGPSNPTFSVQLYDLSIFYLGVGCPGDANGDNVVNFADLNFVLATYGQSGPSVLGDVNHDGTVNFADLNIVLSNFGLVC